MLRDLHALAATILIWLTMVVVYELLVMGSAIMAGLRMTEITALLLANPVESARILMIHSLDPTLLVLGPTGIYLARSLGPLIPVLCIGSLVALAFLSLAFAKKSSHNKTSNSPLNAILLAWDGPMYADRPTRKRLVLDTILMP